MAPGTTIGAAHPIEMGGAEEKGVAATKSRAMRPRLPARLRHSGAATRLGRSARCVKARRSTTARRSSQHVVEVVAGDLPDLLAQASGREVTVPTAQPGAPTQGRAAGKAGNDAQEQLIDKLSDPNICTSDDGRVAGTLLRVRASRRLRSRRFRPICLLLALMSFQVLPINLAGLLLLRSGSAC